MGDHRRQAPPNGSAAVLGGPDPTPALGVPPLVTGDVVDDDNGTTYVRLHIALPRMSTSVVLTGDEAARMAAELPAVLAELAAVARRAKPTLKVATAQQTAVLGRGSPLA